MPESKSTLNSNHPTDATAGSPTDSPPIVHPLFESDCFIEMVCSRTLCSSYATICSDICAQMTSEEVRENVSRTNGSTIRPAAAASTRDEAAAAEAMRREKESRYLFHLLLCALGFWFLLEQLGTGASAQVAEEDGSVET